ncbi:hypothetical protein H257_12060 [Aphanomyces astaci]|uniref:Uncharacterized protein n=1 Tax=Aphanomyces astaci TaxID=112090 RepID=W4FZX2_APHAT|nr:hypothetical protein H257_12060 [Aphanomyces astaci]ETV73022.1 hypothetical protein H257_12060 [Aphanomyces astaci]|eukprot:XP_009837471.1 hypothetical protein H257_12060 [Aphanomyces astaci]
MRPTISSGTTDAAKRHRWAPCVLGLTPDGEELDKTRTSARRARARTLARHPAASRLVRNSPKPSAKEETTGEVSDGGVLGWSLVVVDAWENERLKPSGRYWVPWGAHVPPCDTAIVAACQRGGWDKFQPPISPQCSGSSVRSRPSKRKTHVPLH